MNKQNVDAFLANYRNLCQQFGLMIDSFGQADTIIVSPLYKRRLNEIRTNIVCDERKEGQ